jgi:hypothetical protein
MKSYDDEMITHINHSRELKSIYIVLDVMTSIMMLTGDSHILGDDVQHVKDVVLNKMWSLYMKAC